MILYYFESGVEIMGGEILAFFLVAFFRTIKCLLSLSVTQQGLQKELLCQDCVETFQTSFYCFESRQIFFFFLIKKVLKS